MDSAIKGSVILLGAACLAVMLKRDSAAMRHLVWLVAIVAMLVLPVFSLVLPQWQVLPAWAAISQSSPAIEMPTQAVEFPSPLEVPAAESPEQFISGDFDSRPATQAQQRLDATQNKAGVAQMPDDASWSWLNILPILWSFGFGILLLRLMAARWMLWSNQQRAIVIAESGCPVDARKPMRHESDDAIVASFETAHRQLGIRQRVQLLIDSKRTIPVVWGIVRFRLMLPESARQWSSEQLRSVLLHELAHIKRRDTIVQLLAQVACALHWFNPLVWFAAWRLHVERERACDDLVLAQGVRASAYAEHLLNVATKLAVTRWTSACGLAMASHSPLERRLQAILSNRLNRRKVPVVAGMIGLLIGAGIAIPISMLRAAPQVRVELAQNSETSVKLQSDTVARLKWGEPVNGLRMALAWPPIFDDAALGKKPHFQLVVQNVSEKEIHFLASDDAPNPRELNFRADNRTVLVLTDKDTEQAEWHLQPGHCGVLRMFTKEGRDDDGKTVSAGIEGDLSKIDRNHAVAEMEIAKAPTGAWTGKLITGKTRGSADVVAAPTPMHKDAKAHYEVWQRYARTNGDIPGALVGELAATVKQFIKYNPTWETVPKLNAILPRLDATHDWKSADAIALLDEVAGIQDSPLSPAPWKGTRDTIRHGDALPKKYADVRWGEEQPSGLRAAWVLEPSMAEHRIGTAMKARLLVQNSGQVPVMVQVPTWHQGAVKAIDAKGAEVQASGLSWTTMALLHTVRLGPGAYIEINTPGVGFGPRAGMGPWAGPRVGSNVLAKPDDELTLTYSPVPLDGSEVGVSEDDPHVSGPGWWLAHIKTRLNRELPLPADAAERTRLLDRAVRELFATAPTAEETEAFIAAKTPEALDALAKRLATRGDVVSFSGKLPT
ncbi:MAG: M56 family metallopeptidase, partial [Pirellula sp.]